MSLEVIQMVIDSAHPLLTTQHATHKVLIKLATYASADGKGIPLHQARIAEELHMSLKTVTRALTTLRKVELLVLSAQSKTKRSRNEPLASIYDINIDLLNRPWPADAYDNFDGITKWEDDDEIVYATCVELTENGTQPTSTRMRASTGWGYERVVNALTRLELDGRLETQTGARHAVIYTPRATDLVVSEVSLLAASTDVTATVLYRYWDEDNILLYVGITGAPHTRESVHERRSSWMEFAARSTIERFVTRSEAEDAERSAITEEQPLFNMTHASDGAERRLVTYLVAKDRLDLVTPVVSRG